MGLRLGEGIDLAALGARFGFPETALIDPAKRAFHIGNGLLREEGPRLIVTEAGMPLLDALLAELVPADLVT
jgi:oxygen-independent coproporphyrinogen-3 oxidase